MNNQNNINNSDNQKTITKVIPKPKVFNTIDGNSLMAQDYEPLLFSIEKILPHGIFVLQEALKSENHG